MLTALNPGPGMFPDDTETATEGRWISGQWVRFVRGKPQVMGGWESLIVDTFQGKCRGLHGWTIDGVQYVAVGTHTHLYICKGGAFYDITPVRTSGTLGSNPITTTSGSATVSIAHTSHGNAAGDRVIFSGATAVGGLTISGEYTVTSVTSANAYTITAASAASSSATGGGSSVDFTYLLAVGRADGTGPGGWGTGAWGSGTWGSNTSIDYRPRIWTFDNFGADLLACPMDGTIYRWQGNTSTRAAALTNAPARVNTMFVDPVGIVVAVGSTDAGGTWNALNIRNSDQEAITDWNASATDQAGEFPLYKGSRLVRGMPGRQFNILWTDREVVLMQYTGDPLLPYSYRPLGTGGLIAPNAACTYAGSFFWMGADGQFYSFSGGGVTPISCPGLSYVYDNLQSVQVDKIVCAPIAQWGEIIWIYPDARDGSENSRYALYNVAEGVWSFGSIARTAWIDQSPLAAPLAATADGQLYYHERGDTADGGALSWSLAAAPIDIGDGDTLQEIQAIIPDLKSQRGPVSWYLSTRYYPQATAISNGPYVANTSTERIPVLVRGRQVAISIEGNSAPAFWRMGTPRLDIINTGDRF